MYWLDFANVLLHIDSIFIYHKINLPIVDETSMFKDTQMLQQLLQKK